MVNKVTLIGNLGKDPETRSTAGGSSICNFSLATSSREKDRDGNWTDRTEWHNVVAFGTTADNIVKFCKKGKQLYIEGRIQTRKWQDKEGKDRYTTEIVASEVKFLGPKDGGESGGSGSHSRSRDEDRRPTGNGGGGERYASPDEDIPFIRYARDGEI